METNKRDQSNEISARKATENLQDDRPADRHDQDMTQQGSKREDIERKDQKAKRGQPTVNKEDCDCDNNKNDDVDDEIDSDYFDPVR